MCKYFFDYATSFNLFHKFEEKSFKNQVLFSVILIKLRYNGVKTILFNYHNIEEPTLDIPPFLSPPQGVFYIWNSQLLRSTTIAETRICDLQIFSDYRKTSVDKSK